MLAVGAFCIFSLKSDHYKVDISDLQLQKLKFGEVRLPAQSHADNSAGIGTPEAGLQNPCF